jgi:LytS/YehU family sensor histidine kinase
MGVALERDFRLKRQKLILMKKEYEIQQKTFHLAKLSRLKEKLSPHFFFNSLNTLHAYTNLNSKLAKISIDSMIENYKFLEEHVDSNLVPFDKEWEFTKIYCRLQKVRYLDKLKIKFKKSGDFSNILIPPLSIQPLIENAFKHGFQNSSERIWKLNIEADIINNQIDISIKDNGSGLEYKENYFQRSLGNIQFRINYFFESNSIKISNLDLGGTGIQIQYSPILKSHSHD